MTEKVINLEDITKSVNPTRVPKQRRSTGRMQSGTEMRPLKYFLLGYCLEVKGNNVQDAKSNWLCR